MKREGINDRVVSKTLVLNERITNKITQILKGDKPFAKEPIDPQVVADAVNRLGYMDMQDLVAEFGEMKVNKLLDEVRMRELRRR